MAWPYTGRSTTFTSLMQVPSAHLNDVQDKIVDLYESHTVEILIPLPGYAFDAGSTPPTDGWYYHHANGTLFCSGVSINGSFEFGAFPQGCTINHAHVYYDAGGGSATYKSAFGMYRKRFSGASFAGSNMRSSGEADLTPGTGATLTYICDQNNTNMLHETDVIKINLYNNSDGDDTEIKGIVLNITFNGANYIYAA